MYFIIVLTEFRRYRGVFKLSVVSPLSRLVGAYLLNVTELPCIFTCLL